MVSYKQKRLENEKTLNFLIKRYDEDLTQIQSIDLKLNSLLNVSVLLLTIQLTFLGGTLFSLSFTNKELFISIFLNIFLILFSLNVIFNILSITNFNNGLKKQELIKPLNTVVLIKFLDDKNDFKQLSMNYKKVIEINVESIKIKEKYINEGLNKLFISIVLLIISLFSLFFIFIWGGNKCLKMILMKGQFMI